MLLMVSFPFFLPPCVLFVLLRHFRVRTDKFWIHLAIIDGSIVTDRSKARVVDEVVREAKYSDGRKALSPDSIAKVCFFNLTMIFRNFDSTDALI